MVKGNSGYVQQFDNCGEITIIGWDIGNPDGFVQCIHKGEKK